MSVQRLEFPQEVDETGEPVEFTWDLFPLVEATETRHLDEDGLPKPGTHVRDGMILVGRMGKTCGFDPDRRPSSLEIHGLPFEELRATYGPMWKDYSVYATGETTGWVATASLEQTPDGLKAVIELTDNDEGRFSLTAPGSKETQRYGD